MNICYVCNEYPEGPHGGIGTMIKLLAEELVLEGHSVKVIGVYDLSYPAAKVEARNGVEIIRVKVNYKNRYAVLVGNWIMSRKIRNWINEGLVDIIESPDSYGVFSLFARFKKPFVLRAHGNNTYLSSIWKSPLKKKTAMYERNLYKKAFGYCAVSEFTANKMKLLFNIDKPIAVIYNALQIQKDDVSISENCLELKNILNPVVFSGTLNQNKGICQLVEAVITLLKKRVDITLIINGKDSVNSKTGLSVKSELLELIPNEYKKNFIFNGHLSRNELLCQYRYSKAAIFPSHAEAFAVAPMEAMSVGIPTIYSINCSGKELISDNVDGLLVNPSSVASIANAIEYLLLNPAIAKQIGLKGKEKIELCFSKEKMISNTLKFYEQTHSAFFTK